MNNNGNIENMSFTSTELDDSSYMDNSEYDENKLMTIEEEYMYNQNKKL